MIMILSGHGLLGSCAIASPLKSATMKTSLRWMLDDPCSAVCPAQIAKADS
jgi:hypothetical protein